MTDSGGRIFVVDGPNRAQRRRKQKQGSTKLNRLGNPVPSHNPGAFGCGFKYALVDAAGKVCAVSTKPAAGKPLDFGRKTLNGRKVCLKAFPKFRRPKGIPNFK